MITKTKVKVEVFEPKADYEVNLFQQLKDVRRQLATKENVPAYIVLSDATLIELATYLPHNKEEFRKISGFGEVKIEKYGKQFWDVVADYCLEYNLNSRIHLKTPKRQRKERLEKEKETDTKLQSFEMFKLGHSPKQIAELRGFSPSTIEGHLAFYIQEDKINIDQLMDTSKIPAIQNAIEQVGEKTIPSIKRLLGDSYSYGEIRMVVAYLNRGTK